MEHSPDMAPARCTPTFLKPWREHLGLTQAALSVRLLAEGVRLSPAQLSRIERGEKPYNQRMLEAVARVMGLSPADLLGRHPAEEGPAPLLSLWVALAPNEQSKLLELAKMLFARKPG